MALFGAMSELETVLAALLCDFLFWQRNNGFGGCNSWFFWRSEEGREVSSFSLSPPPPPQKKCLRATFGTQLSLSLFLWVGYGVV